MKTPPLYVQYLSSWLITLFIPFLILIAGVRLVLTPVFVQIEYRTPNFPADPYGFTQADRLHWTPYLVNYLVNNAGSNYLADLKFPDGSPLYTADEIGHMGDVKNLVQAVLKIWLVGAALLILFGIWAWRSNWLSVYWGGVSRGGWLTVAVIVAILLAVLLSFNSLFIYFHQVFFPEGNWMFPNSDTLIRLLPERFFEDCFITVGVFSLLAGLVSGFAFHRKSQ